jgi:WD40 repeat protein
VVTASEDHTARVWNAATGEPLTNVLEHQAAVMIAAFSPDGTRVVTASEDYTARVWDATTGKPLTGPLAHRAGVVNAMFSPDGTHVVTASYDRATWGVGRGDRRAADQRPRASGRGGERRIQPRRHARGHREL